MVAKSKIGRTIRRLTSGKAKGTVGRGVKAAKDGSIKTTNAKPKSAGRKVELMERKPPKGKPGSPGARLAGKGDGVKMKKGAVGHPNAFIKEGLQEGSTKRTQRSNAQAQKAAKRSARKKPTSKVRKTSRTRRK